MSARRDDDPPSSRNSMKGTASGRRARFVVRACLVRLVLLACALASTPDAMRAQTEPLRVLLVYSLSPELPEVASFTKQLRSSMRIDVARPIEFYQEFLDLERFPGFAPRLVHYFEDKYRGSHIDVVLVIG